jgi:DivIVA domain-containing protein
MSLPADEIINKSFQQVRKGYDPVEVKAFLEQIVRDGIYDGDAKKSAQGDDLSEAAEDVRTVLTAAREAAAKLRNKSAAEAQTLVDEAGDKAADIRKKATEEATATLEDAKRKAEQLVEEAKSYSEEQRSAADKERRQLLDGAIKHHEQLMVQERELQEAAKRAEKALGDLNSALRTERVGEGGPQAIDLDTKEADGTDRAPQMQ